jgi:hypothetical protein
VWARAASLVSIANGAAALAALVLVAASWNFVGLVLVQLLARFTSILARLVLAVPRAVWERLGWLAAAQLVAAGSLLADGSIAPLVVLPGCLLAVPLWVASAAVHGGEGGDRLAFAQLVAAHVTATSAAVALATDSMLIGTVTALAITALVGFQIHVSGLCYYIGFTRDTVVSGTAASSAVVATLAAGLTSGWISDPGARFWPLRPAAIRPFGWPIFLWVGIAMHVGLLITTSRGFLRKHTPGQFLAFNTVYVLWVALVAFMAGAADLGPLRAVCGTITVFWVLAKWAELPFWNRTGFLTVGLAGVSAIIYGAAILARTRPEWIIMAAGG